MSNTQITDLAGVVAGVVGLAAFLGLVVVPAVGAYRRVWQRLAVVVLSGYMLAALVGAGIVLGALIVLNWSRVF